MFNSGGNTFGGFGQSNNANSNNATPSQSNQTTFGGFGTTANNTTQVFGQSPQGTTGSNAFGKYHKMSFFSIVTLTNQAHSGAIPPLLSRQIHLHLGLLDNPHNNEILSDLARQTIPVHPHSDQGLLGSLAHQVPRMLLLLSEHSLLPGFSILPMRTMHSEAAFSHHQMSVIAPILLEHPTLLSVYR